ncbi:glycosyltransferase family 2 protein [Citreimonas salinaria]|uniref:Glycosyl transferase family 2 n=1 Tax=Citreimonas salinaria TaxID=321339 RepID=A0A1H3GV31_9RHOB|nr:glycosyltransferase family 2 protein [Citreimonas salinaria]SDY07111.1 Glycosyl transferase family 2 [Citreimonas salinaria]
MTRWGLVATIRAAPDAMLDFAAWHLAQGAARLMIYLDDPDGHPAPPPLIAHPAITVTACDDAWWQARGFRPKKHQVRQCANANHALAAASDLDWLGHVDVDEFLLPVPDAPPLAAQLAALPRDALCARVRPVEALAPAPGADPQVAAFKALHPDRPARDRAARACFPRWGQHLAGGFLSHVAGKVFVRPHAGAWDLRIHNAFLGESQNPGEVKLASTELGHFHASSWPHFRDALTFRLDRGSYRADLRPPMRRNGAPRLHDLLGDLRDAEGEAGLRAFFDEVCTATPALCDRLEDHGLLRRHRMDLSALHALHFP